ncbi:uncharacterized protein LOC123320525 [Coccinella septempunctata]|uniref:uncharacterized protein LOC123320525 n=1 Tax=Coccinella septempunctata TaxID=41139 RepID=UPI001D067350|nr:uncharacterized protein LOC123320525 [Coccinella septempunctata]
MEEEIRHNEASLRLTNGFLSVKPMMQRERRKVQPPIPATLEDAAGYLANASYRKYSLELGPQQRPFFDGIRDGCLFFVSPGILREAIDGNSLHLHMDATFKIVPRAGGAHQLFIIHWMRDYTAYPVVFCMMPNRTRETYTGVLRYTRQLFGASHISSVLCDYEVALRHAVREVFAGISLRGCWFHFAKNVFLKARQMQGRVPLNWTAHESDATVFYHTR